MAAAAAGYCQRVLRKRTSSGLTCAEPRPRTIRHRRVNMTRQNTAISFIRQQFLNSVRYIPSI